MDGAQAVPLCHTLDRCLSVGPAAEPSTQVLSPQSSVKRSAGGRFARSLAPAPAQCRWRSLANYEYSTTGRYAVISCKLQYYANEGCKTCGSFAELLLTFIVVVRGFNQWRQREFKVRGRSAEGVECWEGLFPSPLGERSGEEQPPPRNFFCFVMSKWC